MRSLAGRVVLISGAGSGLGRAIARRLARGGAHSVIGDVNVEGAGETERLIRDDGGSASCLMLDVTDTESVKAVIASTAERFGERFDGLVNNAGTDRRAGILGTSDEQWAQVIAVNQLGPLYLGREFLKMVGPAEREFPADVVNVISTAAIAVGPNEAAYDTSKAALAMLTRVMQREALEDRWPARVHGLMPGGMNTPLMAESRLPKEARMDPDTVAIAVEFMMTLPPDTFIQNLVINSRLEPGWPL
jgi:NAD(P)-dependent dehydrogenase (short-subunit alcohol dehydrogenase family)